MIASLSSPGGLLRGSIPKSFGKTDSIVLWDELDKKLPTAQDPESRQVRKDLFSTMLAEGKKTLTLDDLQRGIRTQLRHDLACSYVPGIHEMTKTIKFAFKASSELGPRTRSLIIQPKSLTKPKGRNEERHSVDKKEFHGFLLALRYYLELAEFFERYDGCLDERKCGLLSCREVLRGKDQLATWNVTEDTVREKFSSVDPWVANMKFDEFAYWVTEFRSLELRLDESSDERVQIEVIHATLKESVDITFADLGVESELNQLKIREKFAEWDLDGNGRISHEEITAVMKGLNPDFTTSQVGLLFKAADADRDGMIDIRELLSFIFR